MTTTVLRVGLTLFVAFACNFGLFAADDVVFETGINNLTQEETPLLVHYGTDRTQQMVLSLERGRHDFGTERHDERSGFHRLRGPQASLAGYRKPQRRQQGKAQFECRAREWHQPFTRPRLRLEKVIQCGGDGWFEWHQRKNKGHRVVAFGGVVFDVSASAGCPRAASR